MEHLFVSYKYTVFEYYYVFANMYNTYVCHQAPHTFSLSLTLSLTQTHARAKSELNLQAYDGLGLSAASSSPTSSASILFGAEKTSILTIDPAKCALNCLLNAFRAATCGETHKNNRQ